MVTLFDALQTWLNEARDVRVATVFGSYARALKGDGQAADPWSDIDLQLVTNNPRKYLHRAWTKDVPSQTLQAYAVRPVFGGAVKVTAMFSGGEVDFVIINYRRLNFGRILFSLGLHRRFQSVSKGLGEFALVMSFGHLVLKGGSRWQNFYSRVVAEVPHARLNDEEVIQISEVAYVDAVSVIGKIERGELVAAQRWLHRSVVETNFRLMHELRVRRGQVSFPDGRRVERLLPPEELAFVRFEVTLEAESLRRATVSALQGIRELLTALTGTAPTWPALV